METTVKFSISVIGTESGKPYNGDFTVKTLLSRRDRFIADAKRREILGPNPDGALPNLQVEAYMLSQLFVRITDAPDFWKQSNGGLELEDLNVISQIFDLATTKEDERIKQVKDEAKSALQEIAKAAKK